MADLADFIEQRAEHILELWVERLRAQIAGDQGTDTQLRDHIPLFLKELIAALRQGSAPAGSRAAEEHGRQRYRIGFDVEALIREYGVLRNVVFDLFDEAKLTLTLREVRVLTDFITNAIAEGVEEHNRARAEAFHGIRTSEAGARAELRASEERWRLVVDTLPVLVSFVTADERYAVVNKAYEDWFGVPREQLIGHEVKSIVGEAAYAFLRPYVKRALAGERVSFEQHGVMYRPHEARAVAGELIPRFDENGIAAGYVTLLQDVTLRWRLAAEGERLSAQRNEVLEAMGDAFFSVDREWRFVLVNRRFEEVGKVGREETLGRVLWELFPETAVPSSEYHRCYTKCMEQRIPVHFDDYYPSLDLWTDVRAYPTADGGISVFFRDVSTAKRAEETLRRQSSLEQQLIGIVSHDLRNPLNVIAMASSMLQKDEELSPPSAKFVLRLRNAAERANRMVGDLLDFTQARVGGGIGIAPRPMDFNTLVRSVVEEVEAAHPTRSVVLGQHGDGAGTWDHHRLGQVVQNLVTNALKYSRPDSTINVTTTGVEDTVTLTVHNEGTPIPAALQPLIFEPFQRAVTNLDTTSRSVGLGLYIVDQIVKAHAGTVRVTSTEADGTTFVVELPRRAAADAASPLSAP